MANAKRDANHVTTMLWVSKDDSSVTIPVKVNPVTWRMLIESVLIESDGWSAWGSDTQVQFNDSWALWGDSNFRYDNTNKALRLDEYLSLWDDDNSWTVNWTAMTSRIASWVDTWNTTKAEIWIGRAENTSAGRGATIFWGRSRGTLDSPTIVQDWDKILEISAVWYDWTDYAQAWSLCFSVDGTPWSNDMPTKFQLKLSADGSQVPSEVLSVNKDWDWTFTWDIFASNLEWTNTWDQTSIVWITWTKAQFNNALTNWSFTTLAWTETLTNKTVNLTNNTLSWTKAQFNTACSDDDFAYIWAENTFSTAQNISTSSYTYFRLESTNSANWTIMQFKESWAVKWIIEYLWTTFADWARQNSLEILTGWGTNADIVLRPNDTERMRVYASTWDISVWWVTATARFSVSDTPTDGERYMDIKYSTIEKFAIAHNANITWNVAWVLWSYHFWVDSTWDLRINSGAPTSDTDWTVVWSQS